MHQTSKCSGKAVVGMVGGVSGEEHQDGGGPVPGHPATTMAHHQWPQVMVWHTEAPAAIQAHKLRHLVPTCGGEMDVGAHWW